MSYQIISRQYRPSVFAQIVGQDPIVETLKNALRKKKIANAYLFCGGRGSGKTTLARLLAKALNCTGLTAEMEPCNTCPSCLELNAGRSLDVLEIDGASNRGIDDIRNLNETVGYVPATGKYKIYIIDEVHMLTKEAFNALLKTLEEPPAHVKFFFATTEPHKVLSTIVSRCQRFDLKAIASEAICQKLKKIAQDLSVECEDALFSLIASRAEGSLRDAESLLDQAICWASGPITAEGFSAALGIPPRSAFFALDRAFETENLSFAFELAQEIFSSGKDSAYFLDLLIEHYHSLLRVHLGCPAEDAICASARLYTQEQCLIIIDYLIQWRETFNKIPFKHLFLEMVLLHILRSKSRLEPRALVQRLLDLEARLKPGVEEPKKQSALSTPEPQQPKTPEAVAVTAPPKKQPTLTSPEPQQLKPPEAVVVTAPPKKEAAHPSRYATLLQFAAVELEGIIKK
jgi:DNA polymerase-3 subunit gamma/tau